MSNLENQDRDVEETEEITAPLTGHNYDGIQEYDNPLPCWWSWLFIGTIVFSVIYFFIAVTTGTLSAVYAYEQDAKSDANAIINAKQYTPDAPTLMGLIKDSTKLKIGQGIYSSHNCVACHGTNGGGLSCPNLTDVYYLDVKKITDIVDVVTNGRKNGAMPAWKTQLTPNEIIFVSAYVASLRGTNVPGGKGSEGVEIPPWSEK